MVDEKVAKTNHKKKEKTEAPTELTNLVDEYLPAPEDQAHLIEGGKLRFLLNRKTIELIREVSDELALSRELPVDPASIQMTDVVVVHILDVERELPALKARDKAILWYTRELNRCQTDAVFIALTDHNDFSSEAKPYEDGEIAFSHEATDGGGSVPKWRKKAAEVQVPPPVRDLSNIYEQRLKILFDFVTECGALYVAKFYTVFNEGMGASLRILKETDADGF